MRNVAEKIPVDDSKEDLDAVEEIGKTQKEETHSKEYLERVETLMRTPYIETKKEAEEILDELGKSIDDINDYGVKFEAMIEETIAQMEAIEKELGRDVVVGKEDFSKVLKGMADNIEEFNPKKLGEIRNTGKSFFGKMIDKITQGRSKKIIHFSALLAVLLGAGLVHTQELHAANIDTPDNSSSLSPDDIVKNFESITGLHLKTADEKKVADYFDNFHPTKEDMKVLLSNPQAIESIKETLNLEPDDNDAFNKMENQENQKFENLKKQQGGQIDDMRKKTDEQIENMKEKLGPDQTTTTIDTKSSKTTINSNKEGESFVGTEGVFSELKQGGRVIANLDEPHILDEFFKKGGNVYNARLALEADARALTLDFEALDSAVKAKDSNAIRAIQEKINRTIVRDEETYGKNVLIIKYNQNK